MEMEPATGWGPYCEFQLANWTVDEPVTEVCAPAAVLPDPLEHASNDMDIFGACYGLEAPVPASIDVVGGGQQLVDYFSVEELRGTLISVRQEDFGARRTRKKQPNIGEPTTGNTNISDDNGGSDPFQQALSEFETDINQMKEKMHRYPASLRYTVDTWCTVPRFVAIGPYHHDQDHLKETEKLKVVATICYVSYVKNCEGRLQEMYNAVASVAEDVRGLYDEDVVEGITSADFQCMMFVDACFLVQFMHMQSNAHVVIDPSLHASLSPKRTDILHDVMLLENQLPWAVVQKVKEFLPPTATTSSLLPDLMSTLRGCLQDHKPDTKDRVPVDWAEGYKPPHLLGLLRYYIVGRKESWAPAPQVEGDRSKGKEGHKWKISNKRSVSQSAVELAKIGIKIVPTKEKNTELIQMDLNVEAGILHGELSLPPLSLNLDRASYLVNMAALEMCTVPSFGAQEAREEDSAVCSYLLLLAMLAYREEDVHELRERGLLQGGGGLTNEDALRFFASLQCLRLGKRYIRIMDRIESFKEKRAKTTTFNEFWYDHKKTIFKVSGAIVSIATIVGTLASVKSAL